jgi:glycosyltransferase involved in cell wall biosynthesis
VRAAERVIANTEALRLDFRRRYPGLDPEKFACVPNGFDAAELPAAAEQRRKRPAGGLVIRHVGSLYAKRDPRPFLRALAAAIAAGEIDRARTVVEFVGENHRPECARRDVLEAMGLAGVVRFLPPVGHREALAALAGSDVVLVLQPDTALQVPAKLYEAIGLGKEVLCLAPEGATATLVRDERLGEVVDPADEGGIRAALGDLARRRAERRAAREAPRGARAKFDARARAKALAEVLDQAVAMRGAAPAPALAPAAEA